MYQNMLWLVFSLGYIVKINVFTKYFSINVLFQNKMLFQNIVLFSGTLNVKIPLCGYMLWTGQPQEIFPTNTSYQNIIGDMTIDV